MRDILKHCLRYCVPLSLTFSLDINPNFVLFPSAQNDFSSHNTDRQTDNLALPCCSCLNSEEAENVKAALLPPSRHHYISGQGRWIDGATNK